MYAYIVMMFFIFSSRSYSKWTRTRPAALPGTCCSTTTTLGWSSSGSNGSTSPHRCTTNNIYVYIYMCVFIYLYIYYHYYAGMVLCGLKRFNLATQVHN